MEEIVKVGRGVASSLLSNSPPVGRTVARAIHTDGDGFEQGTQQKKGRHSQHLPQLALMWLQTWEALWHSNHQS